MSKLANLKKYLFDYGIEFTMKKTASKFHLYEMTQNDFYAKWRKDHLLPKSWKEAVEHAMQDFASKVKIIDGTEQVSLKEMLQSLPKDVRWILFTRPGVKLHFSFYYETYMFLKMRSFVDVIYYDEDQYAKKGKKYQNPKFKPGFSMEYLYGYDYIGSTFLVKKARVEELAEEFDDTLEVLSAYDWLDFKLTLLEKISAMENEKYMNTSVKPCDASYYVQRMEAVLVSEPEVLPEGRSDWRKSEEEIEKVMEIITAHRKKRGLLGKLEKMDVPGYFHWIPELKEKPLVSVIIPNKDHTDDLIQCVESLYQIDQYHHLEVIIVENNSEEEKTFRDYSALLGSEYDPDQECVGKLCEGVTVKIVTWKQGFNYSAINNFGAKFATGEMLLLLNNDTEIISPNTITELVSSCQMNRVGAAGALLYYADDTIQHAGIVYKIGGFAANELTCKEYTDPQYYPYTRVVREMSACTAACLMVRKEVFEKIGGFDEELVVALNDVDLCMRVRARGYHILFNPFATLHHYESKSRGLEETDEKRERFEREIKHFQERWQFDLDEGDPYYNIAFTLHYADYSIEMEEDNHGRYTI